MKKETIIGHAELVSQICAQFIFMQMMSENQDRNFAALTALSIDEVRDKADDYFISKADELGMIVSGDIRGDLDDFLKQFSKVVDVAAIRQNVVYYIKNKNY